MRSKLARNATTVLLAVLTLTSFASAQEDSDNQGFAPTSISALAFHPDGTLLIGDSKAGAIYAVDLGASDRQAWEIGPYGGTVVANFETQVAARLGTTAEQIVVHDMAVHPQTKTIYLAVSRSRGNWVSKWQLPNDLGDAKVLVTVSAAGEIGVVDLKDLAVTTVNLPNPVGDDPHPWKPDATMRSEAITDLVYYDGTVYVAGLSNQEFASTMWKVAYPFSDSTQASSLEVFHGAHGKYETHAPVRTFVPYEFEDSTQLLAAYLCTPFVTFEIDELEDGAHVKGRTIGEFGSGNYPLDMVLYNKDGQDRILIANSNLPLMIVKPEDVAEFEGEITEAVEGYAAGLEYEIRSGAGVQQLDLLTDQAVVALQRTNAGTMDLVALPISRL